MGGEPDHNVRETFAESLDHLQVQLVELGRITRGALQDAKLRIDRHYGAIGAHHVIHRGAAARDDHRLAELGDMAQQRQIDDISRSDLVSRHIECFEEVRARNIESRGEEGYADLLRMRDQFEMLFRGEFQRLTVFAISRAIAVAMQIGRVEHRLGEQGAVVALLQLDRVRAALLRDGRTSSCTARGRPDGYGRSRR